MPKVKWGGGISEEDINNAEVNEYEPYDGPQPPKGIYGWRIRSIKKARSSNNNDQLRVGLVLIPRKDRPDDKRYDGYPQMDFIPVMASTAFRVRPFLDALGISYKQFITATVTDEDGNILKIGNVTPVGMYLRADIRRDENNDEYMKVFGYYPARGPEPTKKAASAAATPAKKAAPAGRRRAEPEPEEDADPDADYIEDGVEGEEDAPF